MGYPFTAPIINNSLIIRMKQLSGYGTITVNYCNDMNFTYQDMNG
jgi:hypothetical protein